MLAATYLTQLHVESINYIVSWGSIWRSIRHIPCGFWHQHTSINLYAYDTTICCLAKDLCDVEDHVGCDLSYVANLIDENGMKIKTLVLSPPYRRQKQVQTTNVHLKAEEIIWQEMVKYLEAVVDNKLNWKPHIFNLCREKNI